MTLSDSNKKLQHQLSTSTPSPLERSKTKQIRELQATMLAAQEQLRPFCLSDAPSDFPGCSWLFVFHVCFRPLLERFALRSWKGFYVELARLGGPSGVLTLLTIARIDSDGTGDIDEAELREFDQVAAKLILDTCDALQTSALVCSLLFGAVFQTVIGRPTFLEVSSETYDQFGQTGAEVLAWVAYIAMTLISVLCLIVIAYAYGSRMELQNVLPSTQARLFYLCEVNPMNAVTAMTTICMLLFIVLIVMGGLLYSPTRGWFTLLAVPLFGALATPLWKGMRNGPIRLRLEARAFLGIENRRCDLVKYTPRPHSNNCRLKNYLAAHTSCQTRGAHPSILAVIEDARAAASMQRQQQQHALPEPSTAEGSLQDKCSGRQEACEASLSHSASRSNGSGSKSATPGLDPCGPDSYNESDLAPHPDSAYPVDR